MFNTITNIAKIQAHEIDTRVHVLNRVSLNLSARVQEIHNTLVKFCFQMNTNQQKISQPS